MESDTRAVSVLGVSCRLKYPHATERPPFRVSATPTESHREAPAVGRSHRPQKKLASVWTALTKHGIEEPYVQLLRKLYDQQRASAHTDLKKSKHFHLERGTIQGDPLSTLLFNSLLQNIMKPLTGKWKRCDQGVRLAEHDPNTNLSTSDFQTTFLSSAAH